MKFYGISFSGFGTKYEPETSHVHIIAPLLSYILDLPKLTQDLTVLPKLALKTLRRVEILP